MKKILIIAGVIWLVATEIKSQNHAGFAVVELYTSQGCSSCPSADKVLSKIIDNAEGKPVYGLSFHVDYWDYLGWKDPFSSKAYTNRQRKYAIALRSSSVYTPQMIINGTDEFVGSNGVKAEYLVKSALQVPAAHQVKFEVDNQGPRVAIEFRLSGATTNKVINFALVERNIKTNVTRGENRNRLLAHDNVVRGFLQIPASIAGEIEMSIPNDLVISNAAVIVYVQDEHTYEITGSASAPL